MQLLKNQTTNTEGGGWQRPGPGKYTVGGTGVWDGASVQLQIGKPVSDTAPEEIVALPDDPELAISEGDAPFTIILGAEDFVRAVVDDANDDTNINLWIG